MVGICRLEGMFEALKGGWYVLWHLVSMLEERELYLAACFEYLDAAISYVLCLLQDLGLSIS